MLTRQELNNNIDGSVNKKWEPEAGLTFYKKGDDTIWVDWQSKSINFQAFLINGNNDMGEFYLSTTGSIKDANDLILFIKKVAKHTEYELKIDEAKTVERPVVDAKEESRLTGKVEAYEKILINRELTISK